jgi:hypothetical protein
VNAATWISRVALDVIGGKSCLLSSSLKALKQTNKILCLTITLEHLITLRMNWLQQWKDCCEFSDFQTFTCHILIRIRLQTFGSPSKKNLMFLLMARLIPVKALTWLFNSAPIPRFASLRTSRAALNKVARKLVQEKQTAIEQGYGRHDILSLCIQANNLQNPRGKMSEEELMGQLRCVDHNEKYESVCTTERACATLEP